MSGWASKRESSVVLPLPRKPVRRTTDVFSGEGADKAWVEGVERRAVQPLRLDPQRTEVRDDGRAAFAVTQDVGPAAPVVEMEAEVIEDAVQQGDPQRAAATAAFTLGPVLLQ